MSGFLLAIQHFTVPLRTTVQGAGAVLKPSPENKSRSGSSKFLPNSYPMGAAEERALAWQERIWLPLSAHNRVAVL